MLLLSRRVTRVVFCAGLSLATLARHALAQGTDQPRRAPAPTAAAVAQLPFFADTVAPMEETVFSRAYGDWRSGGFTQVTLYTPRSLAAVVRRDSLVPGIVERCFRTPGATGSRNAALEAARELPRPWASVDSALAGRAFVLLQIVAPVARQAPCAGANEGPIELAGIQLVDSAAQPSPRRDLRAVTMMRAGVPIAPEVLARAPSALVARDVRLLDAAPGMIRVYLSPDAIAPDARGRFAPMILWVASADSSHRDSVLVTDSIVAQTWRDFVPWRLERLRGQPALAPLPRLPTPRDASLRAAAARYAAGDDIGAALLAARKAALLLPAQRRTPEARDAAVILGSVFLAHGDSAAARAAYADALVASPCLRLAEHPRYDAMLERVRPAGARCSSVPPLRQLLAGVVFPGGAQWAQRQRFGGAVATLVTGALLGIAIQREQNAQSQFDAYRAALPPAPVPLLLDRANRTQRSAHQMALAGAATWAASAVIGLATEAIHAARVRGEQHYEPARAEVH